MDNCPECYGKHVATAVDLAAASVGSLCVCPCCRPAWTSYVETFLSFTGRTWEPGEAAKYVDRRCDLELETRLRLFGEARVTAALAASRAGG